jgi:hypothetical protein
MTREEFEKFFKDINASLEFEDAALSDEEKELLYKRFIGEISDEEYNEALLNRDRRE